MKAPKVAICPKCGFKATMRSDVVELPGELQKLTKGAKKATAQDKQHLYSQLLAVKAAKGYSDGWVAHKYRAKFGVWPKGMKEYAIDPTPEVKAWLLSQVIAFANRRTDANRAAA